MRFSIPEPPHPPSISRRTLGCGCEVVVDRENRVTWRPHEPCDDCEMPVVQVTLPKADRQRYE